MLVVSPLAKPGFKSTVAANHYSLLRTIQDAWGLLPLGQSATARAMTEFFQVSSTTPPGAPTGLVGTASGSSIRLTWNPPATGGAPTSYVIQAGTAPGLSDLGSAATGSTVTTVSATGVPAGTYYFRVAAQNSAGVSAPSNEVALPVLVPGNPTALTGSASGTSITLSWHAPTTGAAPSAYLLEVGTAPGLSDLGRGSTGSLATTFSATGIAARTYYIRVRALNAAGASAPSNEIELIVGAPTTSRNMLTWPFSTDSIWNMPIGSAAVYQSTGLSAATEIFGDVDYFIQLRASDPLTALYNDENVWSGPRCSSTQPTGASLNIASSLIVPDAVGSNTPNNSAAFLKPDGHTLEQVNALARCVAGGRVFGVARISRWARMHVLANQRRQVRVRSW
jgi:Fibronectin type III domain